MTTRLILASASPQRARLLEQLQLDFQVAPAAIDETPLPGEVPAALAERLARCKAEALSSAWPQARILGSDTVVAAGSEPFGKPDNLAQARRMLWQLSGGRHWVYTGIALWHAGHLRACTVASRVTMMTLDETMIAAYWATGEPAGAAGGYAIQGQGAQFITHLSGSYSAVMGLPVHETAQLLRASGLAVLPRAVAGPGAMEARHD